MKRHAILPLSTESSAERLFSEALALHVFKPRVPQTVWFDFGNPPDTSRQYTFFISAGDRILAVLRIRFSRPDPTVPAAVCVNDQPVSFGGLLGIAQLSPFPSQRTISAVQTSGLEAPISFDVLTGAAAAPSLVLI